MADDVITAEELAELRSKAELYDDLTASNKAFAKLEAERGADVKLPRELLQTKLPLGCRLVHYDDGSAKKEWYSASFDAEGAMQSAGSQALLIQRCHAWDAERARRNGEKSSAEWAADVKAASKPSSGVVSA